MLLGCRRCSFERRSVALVPRRFALSPTREAGRRQRSGEKERKRGEEKVARRCGQIKAITHPKASSRIHPCPRQEPTPENPGQGDETFPRRAEEKRGLSQDVRDLPLLRRGAISSTGVLRRRSSPLLGIFFRREARRATRSTKTGENFGSFMNGQKSGAEGNVASDSTWGPLRRFVHRDESRPIDKRDYEGFRRK